MAKFGKGKPDQDPQHLKGSRGDDTYVIEAEGMSIFEGKNGGTDTVFSSVSYTLDTWVEDLWLEGESGLAGTGNALANQIYGNSGDNILSGGDGDDRVSGGSGNDVLSGGDGSDVAIFSGSVEDYVFEWQGEELWVSKLLENGSVETDILGGFEVLSFDDGDIAVSDLLPDEDTAVVTEEPLASLPPDDTVEEPATDETPPPTEEPSSETGSDLPDYIQALIDGDGVRWPADDDSETTTITFAFLDEVPDYYAADAPEREGFQPFNDLQETTALDALDLIESYTNIEFQEVAPEDAMIAFGTADLNSGSGWAYSPSVSQDVGLGGDVWIDNQFAENNEPLPGTDGYQTIFHEIGHALGLNHSHESGLLTEAEDSRMYTVMSYRDHMDMWGVEPETYMSYDIAALQYLYGENQSTATGDDVYSFDDPDDLVGTIYDAGGNDTIDASQTEDDVVLDLRDGGFSSIGTAYGSLDAANNISIAIGTEIENAIGGTGNDLIIGNDLNNVLTGNAGNDVFDMTGGGQDQITDFEAGTDKIDMTDSGFKIEDLFISATETGTLVEFGDHSLALDGVDEADVSEEFFLF